MVLNGEDGQCECTSCQIARLTDIVAELLERVDVLEEIHHSLEVIGDVKEDGKVTWREEGEIV